MLTASQTIDAKTTHVGPRIVITLLDVKVQVWSALSDNVNLITISGNLDVKMMKTVEVMLSSAIKDTAGELPVTKAHKSLEKKIKMELLLLLLLQLLLLLL